MRILDLNTDKSVKEAIIYLKKEETKTLLDTLKQLVIKNDLSEHYHIKKADQLTLLFWVPIHIFKE